MYLTSNWTKLSPKGLENLTPRWGHATALYNDRMYIFGGFQNGIYLNDLSYLDLTRMSVVNVPKFQTLGQIPKERSNFAYDTYTINNTPYLIIHGGIGSAEVFSDTYCLNLYLLKWTKLNTVGEAPERGYHTANIINNHMIVIGGENKGEIFNDICALNLISGVWYYS